MSGLGHKKVHKQCGEIIWKAYLLNSRGEYELWFLNERKTPLVDGRCPRCEEVIVVSDLDDSMEGAV